MSTLKVGAINNPAASSGGLAISASGNVTGAGLDLITEQSFSAVSSVSVNNCFSVTHERYLIHINVRSVSTTLNILMRMRASGTDHTGSNYCLGGIFRTNNSNTHTSSQDNTNSWFLSGSDSGQEGMRLSMTMFDPETANKTVFSGTLLGTGASSTGFGGGVHGGFLRTTAAYDGFTVFTDAGNITGDVYVYGYKGA